MGAKEILRKKAKVNTFIIFLIVFGGLLAFSVPGLSPLAHAKSTGTFNAPESFIRLAEMASPAVVNIRIEKTIKTRGPSMRQFQMDPWGREKPFKDFFERFFGEEAPREFKQPSVGSGFIIDKSGYVVTNNHVIEDADKIVVKLDDDHELDATVVGRDPNTDIALLKVDSDTDLPFIKMGNSKELKIGQWVVAIGSPFGLERTVTAGIVSAKGRVIGSGPYDDFIQTDASINPGNSGGPLINMDGEVVGINTAIIASASGIGFAIPISLAQGIIAQLKSEGEVTRGWLGVAIQDLTSELAEYYGLKDRKGVLVADVFRGDPADKAGIRAKDIILEVNDQKIETSRQLTTMIAGLKVGQTAKVEVFRDRKIKTFSIKLAKRDETKLKARNVPQGRQEEEELGIRVSELTDEMTQRFNLEDMTGVVVMGVADDSKGAEAGIQIGDIIKEINHRVIESVDDYITALQKVKDDEIINFFVWRRNAGFLVIKVTK
jgi:serine protease Do